LLKTEPTDPGSSGARGKEGDLFDHGVKGRIGGTSGLISSLRQPLSGRRDKIRPALGVLFPPLPAVCRGVVCRRRGDPAAPEASAVVSMAAELSQPSMPAGQALGSPSSPSPRPAASEPEEAAAGRDPALLAPLAPGRLVKVLEAFPAPAAAVLPTVSRRLRPPPAGRLRKENGGVFVSRTALPKTTPAAYPVQMPSSSSAVCSPGEARCSSPCSAAGCGRCCLCAVRRWRQ
jgi:hypothetical protein